MALKIQKDFENGKLHITFSSNFSFAHLQANNFHWNKYVISLSVFVATWLHLGRDTTIMNGIIKDIIVWDGIAWALGFHIFKIAGNFNPH